MEFEILARIAGLRANDTSSGSRQASDVRQAGVGLITLKFRTRMRTLACPNALFLHAKAV